MPFALFTKIREVSSEDKRHLAVNLIGAESGKKWKTENVGEKSAYVVLEMDETQQISGIDIGNEHSAFVEVLVGNPSYTPSDFKEILITCSFMTPIESRNSNNTNRVRCFNADALVQSVAEKKWSLVKIICTQPFNKHVQYGLSFIKVHVAQKQPTSTKSQSNSAHELEKDDLHQNFAKVNTSIFGKFKLREDSPESESEGQSNLFSRWKKIKDEKSDPTTAASIRKATSLLTSQKTRNSNEMRNENLIISDRNRDTLLFGVEDEDIEAEKKLVFSKKLEADKQKLLSEQEKQKNKKITENKKDGKEDKNRIQNVDRKYVDGSIKRRSSPLSERSVKKEKILSKRYKPFNELLKGVVLVISGIQNPDRSNLRSKALALGATYKGDWDKTCTHLICAFKNTPKYNQVKGQGKIITRSWIEKCYSEKKYLPWRRYALDSQDLAKPESDEEICDDSLRPSCSLDTTKPTGNSIEDHNVTSALYDLGNKDCEKPVRRQSLGDMSESDTDDEILRIETRNNMKTREVSRFTNNNSKQCYETAAVNDLSDVYDLPTDEEDYLQDKLKQCIE